MWIAYPALPGTEAFASDALCGSSSHCLQLCAKEPTGLCWTLIDVHDHTDNLVEFSTEEEEKEGERDG